MGCQALTSRFPWRTGWWGNPGEGGLGPPAERDGLSPAQAKSVLGTAHVSSLSSTVETHSARLASTTIASPARRCGLMVSQVAGGFSQSRPRWLTGLSQSSWGLTSGEWPVGGRKLASVGVQTCLLGRWDQCPGSCKAQVRGPLCCSVPHTPVGTLWQALPSVSWRVLVPLRAGCEERWGVQGVPRAVGPQALHQPIVCMRCPCP